MRPRVTRLTPSEHADELGQQYHGTAHVCQPTAGLLRLASGRIRRAAPLQRS